MEIIQYTPDLLTPLTKFYNDFTADVPHCYPVKEEDLAFATSGVTGKSKYYAEEDIKSETAFVAVQNGKVKAFLHLGLMHERENGIDMAAHILFFGCALQERQAGQAILEKAEDYLRRQNVTMVYVYSKHFRYPCYYFASAELSNRLCHVDALLGYNGYSRIHGQAIFDWENFNVVPTLSEVPVTLSLEWKDGRGELPNCIITAEIDGKEVGVCRSLSGGMFSSHPDAQKWVYTEWLGVEEKFQDQGLGKYLLEYSLQEMHKVGYRHASLSTGWDNNEAFLMYSNCGGYKVVDWTYAYSKRLERLPEVRPEKSEHRCSEVIKYTPDLLQPLTQFYNDQIADIANCFPVSEDEFLTVLGGLTGEKEKSNGSLEEEALFLSINERKVKAFIHVGINIRKVQNDDEDSKEVRTGYIRFFGYERGEWQVGQAVLEKAEEHLNSFEVSSIYAFTSNRVSRYPFYGLVYTKLSSFLDHLQGILTANGYRPSVRNVFLNWEDYVVKPVLPDPSLVTTVHWEGGIGDREFCIVKIFKEEMEVGDCESISAGVFLSHPDAQDWVFTEWLGIEKDLQGKGLGKFLLQYSLQEMQKAGFRHASISTELENHRAILFYSNLGYKVVDWTYEYHKKIE